MVKFQFIHSALLIHSDGDAEVSFNFNKKFVGKSVGTETEIFLRLGKILHFPLRLLTL